MEKKGKTINFDLFVLRQLERRAKDEHTSVSNIVNMLCRRAVLQDAEFFRQMAKEHWLKFQEYQFLKEQALIKIE